MLTGMAMSNTVLVSEKLINVSQGYETPSKQASSPMQLVAKSIEIVEDSMPKDDATTIVKSSQLLAEFDADELYRLTPDIEAQSRRVKATASANPNPGVKSDDSNRNLFRPLQRTADHPRDISIGGEEHLELQHATEPTSAFAQQQQTKGKLPLIFDRISSARDMPEVAGHEVLPQNQRMATQADGPNIATGGSSAKRLEKVVGEQEINGVSNLRDRPGLSAPFSALRSLRRHRAGLSSALPNTQQRRLLPETLASPAHFPNRVLKNIPIVQSSSPSLKDTNKQVAGLGTKSGQTLQEPRGKFVASTVTVAEPKVPKVSKQGEFDLISDNMRQTSAQVEKHDTNSPDKQQSESKEQTNPRKRPSTYDIPVSPENECETEPLKKARKINAPKTTKTPAALPRGKRARGRPAKSLEKTKLLTQGERQSRVPGTSEGIFTEKHSLRMSIPIRKDAAESEPQRASPNVRKNPYDEKDLSVNHDASLAKNDLGHIDLVDETREETSEPSDVAKGAITSEISHEHEDASRVFDDPIDAAQTIARPGESWMCLENRTTPKLKIANAKLQQSAETLTDNSARKPVIISWNKFGPRNQGRQSAQKRQSAPAGGTLTIPSNIDSSSVARYSMDAITTTSSIPRPKLKLYKPKAKGNVAQSVSEALTSFSTQQNKSEQVYQHELWNLHRNVSTKEMSTDATPIKSISSWHVISDDDHEEQHDGEATAVDYNAARLDGPRTASQVLMPPPSTRPLSKLRGDGNLAEPENRGVESLVGSLNTKTAKRPTESSRPGNKRVRIDLTSPSRHCSLTPSVSPQIFSGVIDDGAAIQQNDTDSSLGIAGKHRISGKAFRGTVDMCGSPIPPGMVIDQHMTVLETFSQHDLITPDGTDSDTTLQQNTAELDRAKSSPAHKSKITLVQESRPHTSPAGRLHSRGRKALKPWIGHHSFMDPRQALFAAQKTSPRKPMPRPEPSRKNDTQNSTLPRIRDELNRVASAMPEKRIATPKKSKRAQPFTRPVEHRRAQRRLPSYESVSSISTAAENSISDPMHDVMVWRAGLEPHQLALFDELVHVSYNMVSLLLDRDNVSRAVHEYRQLGLELVTLVEKTRSSLIENDLQALKKHNEDLMHEMQHCRQRLKAVMREATTTKRNVAQHQERKTRREDAVRSLLAGI